jgi:hypothetical protein
MERAADDALIRRSLPPSFGVVLVECAMLLDSSGVGGQQEPAQGER